MNGIYTVMLPLLAFLTFSSAQQDIRDFLPILDLSDHLDYIPSWKIEVCKMLRKTKLLHYTCTKNYEIKCAPGWRGKLCQVPICRKGCHPIQGYCKKPGECRCYFGYIGEFCQTFLPQPGCQWNTCSMPELFITICRDGWIGHYCSMPVCSSGCNLDRGYCDEPYECKCLKGWRGSTCDECATADGCQHGTCENPLDCICLPGYKGDLCDTPICSSDCHPIHGYCHKPGECRCHVGWMGKNCDTCHPYPGCVNGNCNQPWECNCSPGWGGMFCNETLTHCSENPLTCQNGGTCISLTKDDGLYNCTCPHGYHGRNCENAPDEPSFISPASSDGPRITPPLEPSTIEALYIMDFDTESEETTDLICMAPGRNISLPLKP